MSGNDFFLPAVHGENDVAGLPAAARPALADCLA